MISEQKHNEMFEDEVRRVARALWPSAAFGGAQIEDGRERDGVFLTEDVVHVVEATVSRSKSYVQAKCGKLKRLSKSLRGRYPDRVVRFWIVTKDEPTAEQRSELLKHLDINITLLSLDLFRARLINVGRYLDNRTRYPFGSARNPETGKPIGPEHRYVRLTIRSQASPDVYSVKDLSLALANKTKSYLILGDYGAGKSMTLREVFNVLAEKYRLGQIQRFPLLLNLRDHQGQTDPQEALERHARRIGHEPPSDLVRAWRFGYAIVLLDGFDELAATGWTEQSKRLRDIRYRSMELVRQFVREGQEPGGMAISGRLHYFDSRKEMSSALGLDEFFETVALDDFSEEQVRDYLKANGWEDGVPDWLPSRPLLLSYLFAKGLLADVLAVGTGLSAASGWDSLITAISNREASIEAGIDGPTVRRVLERLGTRVRLLPSGMGPITPSILIAAFSEVCGYAPDDRAMVLLQRLPGLGVAEGNDSERVFVDTDLAEAIKAGDVHHFLADPFSSVAALPEVRVSLEDLGCQIVAHRSAGISEGQYLAAIERAQKLGGVLQVDVLRAMYAAGLALTKRNLVFEDLWIPEWTFVGEVPDFSLMSVRNSVVGELRLVGLAHPEALPKFHKCLIAKLLGPASGKDVPVDRFIECEILDVVPIGSNTAQLMAIDIPLGARVLMTILEKIFLQPGRGRTEGALYRGLDTRSQSYVGACLDLLRRHHIAFLSRRGDDKVWHPVRSKVGEVRALLSSPDPDEYDILRDAWDVAP